MPAPFTPAVRVDAGFGSSPVDDIVTWTSLAAYHPRDVTISRGRPSELDRFKPARCSLELVDSTSRALDPTNLSGPYVETVNATTFPMLVGSVATEVGTSLGTNNSITLPTGVTAGELLLAYVTVDLNGGAGGISTGTGSATWTELFDDANGTIVRHALYARIATGSDALVLTGPTEDYVVEIVRVGRHGCATTADIAVGTTVASSGTGINPPSLNAGSTKKWLWFELGGVDCTTTTLFTGGTGTGFTLVDQEISAVSTTSVGLTWAYTQEEIATRDPGSMPTNFTRDWVANTIAVPPETSATNRTQIVTNTPLRVVATLAAAVTVLNDAATGPEIHSAWKVVDGAITGSISGSYPVAPGVIMTGPAFNFDGPSSFQFGTAADGASPNHDVRIVLSNGGHIGWNLTGTTLTYHVFDGGSTLDDVVTWNDATMRYLRIRFSGNDVIWERSADASSWTTIDTYTRGSEFSSTVDWSFAYLYVANDAAATTPSLDDFVVQTSNTTLFTGTVDAWEYVPLGGNRGAVVGVSATDAFKTFANTQLPQRWQEAVAALDPVAWYPLGETDGIVAYDATQHGHNGIYPAVVAQGQAPVTPVLGNGSCRMVHNYPPTFIGVALPASARQDVYPWTFNMWVKPAAAFDRDGSTYATGATAPGALFFQGSNGTNSPYIDCRLFAHDFDTGTGDLIETFVITLDWQSSFAGGVRRHSYGPVPVGDASIPRMITVVATSDTVSAVYVDGVSQTYQAGPFGDVTLNLAAGFGLASGLWIGPPSHVFDPLNPFNTAWWGLDGFYDEFTIHDAALSDTEISALYEAGAKIGDGDTTGARINRVLDLIGWPAELRRVDSGTTTMSADYIFGESVLSYLQKVELTEGGRLFIGPHGEVVFHDAERIDTRGSAPVLFDDAGAGVNILGEGFVLTGDEAFLFTGAQVTRTGGLEQTYRDTDAVARYGVRDWSATLLARTDLEAYLRAVGMVGRYKDPKTRIGSWTVAPEKRPADWGPVLDVRLGDTVRVQFQLLDTGASYDEYLDVAQVVHKIGSGAWEITYMGTPQDPGIGLFFEFDAPASADVGWDYGEWR